MKRTAQNFHDPRILQAMRAAGQPGNGCVAAAVARALAAPNDVDEAVEWMPLVVETLRSRAERTGGFGLRDSGYRGGISTALDEVGLSYREQRETPHRMGTRKVRTYWDEQEVDVAYFPTVAKWLRDNPWVRRAVLHTDGHASFADHGKVYATSMRRRVTYACIIDEDEQARDEGLAKRFGWNPMTGAEIVDLFEREAIVNMMAPDDHTKHLSSGPYRDLFGGLWKNETFMVKRDSKILKFYVRVTEEQFGYRAVARVVFGTLLESYTEITDGEGVLVAKIPRETEDWR